MSICQKFILKERIDRVLMTNHSVNQHVPTYYFVLSSLSTTESTAPIYFDIQYGNDFQFYRNFFQYISPIFEPKQNIRQINQDNEKATQAVMREKPLKRIEKKKQEKKQIHFCQRNSFKNSNRRNIYKKDQDRNILPNAVSKIFFFLRSKKKSKNLVQKILQTNIKKTNQMSCNKFYTYQNLIRSKLSRYMTVQALEQLFSLVDPSLKLFNLQQQLTFIKINGILLRIFIRKYLNIQGIVNQAPKGSHRIKTHLQKYRVIQKKVEQQIQKLNGSLMFNKSQENSNQDEQFIH